MAEKFSGEYRQGYLQGYREAFENMVALLKRDDYAVEEAKDTCRDLWINQLSDWLENDGDIPVLNIPQKSDQEVEVTYNPFIDQSDPYAEKMLEAG